MMSVPRQESAVSRVSLTVLLRLVAGLRTISRLLAVAPLLLVVAAATPACNRCRPSRPAMLHAQSKDRSTMTTKYEAQITRHIVEYEASHKDSPAIFAAHELSVADPYAPAEVTTEYRQESRIRRVALWGRLFSAIDAVWDARFDPEKPPFTIVLVEEPDIPAGQSDIAIDDLTDPVVRKKYQDRREKARQDSAWFHEQLTLRQLNSTVVEFAEDYFKSAFVRSAKSVALIDSCAESGKWALERRNQVRAWVQPKE